MSEALFDLIPAERRESARSAVAVAFGPAWRGALCPVTTGNSGALIYRLDVGEKAYLLRLESQSGGFRQTDATYLSMELAAAAGVAPPVRYADAAAGVAIQDFLIERPLGEFPGGAEGLAREVGGLIARLQRGATFPAFAENYPAVLRRMLDELRGSGLFQAGLLDPHVEMFERICSAYPWDAAARVASHNDLHPGNLLFDGSRLWLIDWETACCNDRCVDVAIALTYFGNTPELEAVLLKAWLGGTPDPLLRARLVLMRSLVLIFYASAPNGLSAARESEPEADLTAPTPAAFWAAVEAGELVLGPPDTMVLGRKVALRAFLERTRTAEFEKALDLVRAER